MNNSNHLPKIQNKRWSRRSFAQEIPDMETIKIIFDSGRNVASSYNEQPWSFILASLEDPEFEKMLNCLTEFNRSWCTNAPYLGISLGKKHFKRNEKLNVHNKHDVGAFMAVASLRAVEMGLFIHQMAGFSKEKVRENFNIPEEYEVVTMFAIGKPGEKDNLPEDLREKENPDSERNEVSQFLFKGDFGNKIRF